MPQTLHSWAQEPAPPTAFQGNTESKKKRHETAGSSNGGDTPLAMITPKCSRVLISTGALNDPACGDFPQVFANSQTTGIIRPCMADQEIDL
jgi:hypothetical protein